MMQDAPKQSDAGAEGPADRPDSQPGSGSGADTALKAMLRNRQTRHTGDDEQSETQDSVDSGKQAP